jgi:hypothetical protein
MALGKKGKRTPIVSYFSQDGQPHTYRSNTYVSWPFSYQTDEKVKIYYDPKNPNDAQIKDNMFWEISITLVGGILFFLSLHTYFQHFKLTEIIEAKIVSVDCVKSNRIIGNLISSLIGIPIRNPFVITCQWFSNHDNTVYTFKSLHIWKDPTGDLEQTNYLNVFIDPNNPKKYFVDISFLLQPA